MIEVLAVDIGIAIISFIAGIVMGLWIAHKLGE